MKRTILALLSVVLLQLPTQAPARQSLTTHAENGRPLFKFEIFDFGESAGDQETSTWTAGENQRKALRDASDYWQSLLGDLPVNSEPAKISVRMFDDENASASSDLMENGMTELAVAVLADAWDEESDFLAHINIGYLSGFGNNDYYGSVTLLPENGENAHLGVALIHELGHAMGILASRDENSAGDIIFDADSSSLYNAGLRDSWGNAARPGMPIAYGSSQQLGSFTVYTPDGNPRNAVRTFFTGTNVAQVLDGASLEVSAGGSLMPNHIPINGFEGGIPDLSHIELRNSMMSHQRYSNWSTYMEAELALLQDIGINLDRKKFYGYSIYRDQGSLTVDASKLGWSQTTYNPTPWAVGLHIYGTNNEVSLQANALSSGFSSAGIRIDGWGNRLTIEPGARAHANGKGGTALMVAYGKEHEITMHGDLQATGSGGIGARFDFGSSNLGDNVEYRGSYIRTEQGANMGLLPELGGALVTSFDVTGTIAGSQAAIFMSENALVENINIMQGAQLYGDIVSAWDPRDSRVQLAPGSSPNDYMTDLAFGYAANAVGQSTGAADPNFTMAYRGNILGEKGLTWSLRGGKLEWGGQGRVFDYAQKTGSNLLVDASVGGTIFAADSLAMEPGSAVGVRTGWFSYGAALPAQYPVLTLQGPTVNNQSSVQASSGSFARGFYDYSYTNPRWSADRRSLLVDTVNHGPNPERSGRMAVHAPFAVALQNPSASLLRDQQAVRFGLKRADIDRGLGDRTQEGEAARTARLKAEATGSQYRLGNGTFWATPSFAYTEKRNSPRYTIKTPTFIMGFDTWLNDHVMTGVALSTSFARFTSGPADVDADNVTVIPYAGFLLPQDFELGVYASYGYTDYDQRRHVEGRKHTADYSSDTYAAGLSLARPFVLDESLRLRPFVGYEYIHLETDRYKESDGIYGLNISRNTTDTHRVEAGAELEWYFRENSMAGFSAWYSGLYGDRRGASDVRFSLDGDRNTLNSKGYNLDRHSLGLGVDLGVNLTDSVFLGGGYNFLGGSDHLGHQVNLKLEYNF